MFDLIAHRYDFINRALALNLDLSWRRKMVNEILQDGELLRQKPSAKFLDLATGTADVAILLGQTADKYISAMDSKNDASVEILGIDPSFKMIHIGKEKVSKQDFSHVSYIHLQTGDARDLQSIPSDFYDGVTISFGIRNIPERHLAFCEIHRVLRKDERSKLAILEFSEPTPTTGGFVGYYLARWFIRYVVPVLGAVLSGAPTEYMHLQNSIKEFPSAEEFVREIEAVRCDDGRSSVFRVQRVHQLNFGSVQLYIVLPLPSSNN